MNWQMLISGLLSAGKTKSDIARAAGVDWATIHKLSIGRTKEPMHSAGSRILALYKRVCGNVPT